MSTSLKIAVVGGSGYIGQALLNAYRGTNHQITIFDSINSRVFKCGWDFIKTDIRNNIFWNLEDFDIVYNLAAITSTKSDDERLKIINEQCAIDIAKRSKRYIFASSCNVFGGTNNQEVTFDETSETAPATDYAISKFNVEKWLKENHKNYIICRFGMNYGVSEFAKSTVINTFIENSLKNEDIKLLKNEVRPYCHVKDTARALYFLAHNKIKKHIFHIVSSCCSLHEMAVRIKVATISNSMLVRGQNHYNFSGYYCSGNKIEKLDFKYYYGLHDAIEEIKILNIKNDST